MRGLDGRDGQLKPWLTSLLMRTSWLSMARRTFGQNKNSPWLGQSWWGSGQPAPSMPDCRSDVSDGYPPFFFSGTMATKDTKLSSEPIAREQGVLPNNSRDASRKSSSRQNKAGEGSCTAPASDESRESATVDTEKNDNDKKSRLKQKKAGECSTNAPASDEGRENPTVDTEKNNDRQGENLDLDEDEDGMTEDTTGTSVETPAYIRLITDLHKRVLRVKVGDPFKQSMHEIIGNLGALFDSMQEENIRLRAENRVLSQVKTLRSYASVTKMVAVAPCQLPQVIQRQRGSETYCVHILRRQRSQGDSEDTDNYSKSDH